ncbi:MAG: aromatic ring-hydroxylating dioxygenase subunit alpha [Gemmatimonadetes bacterium]|nr:aromatic ring-hydroxylating dioxygenase subunit alpha [Gemmatimonadota bacterium]
MITDPVLVHDWHPVATPAQVDARGLLAARLLGVEIVLWKSPDGYRAWRDLCVHRGARLSGGTIADGCLHCPYHGWTYDAGGACVRIPAHPDQVPPAKARATAYRITERYGLLWVSLGEPGHDVPAFPEWGKVGYACAVCDPIEHVQAHGPRLIENFLDVAHFPFVHEGVLGDKRHADMSDYECHVDATGVRSDPVLIWQPVQHGTEAGGRVSYTYRVERPYTAHMHKRVPAGWWAPDSPAASHGLMLTITPHGDMDSTVWFLIASDAWTDPAALQVDYTKRITAIFEEDRAVVMGQRPELLPLDLQAELHLKSDRVAIAYRKYLRQLGLQYGAA